jgi:hypothetical protein
MNYVFSIYFIVLGILGVRHIYASLRFLHYCRKHYPAKASDFLSLGDYTMGWAVFKTHDDIDDSNFVVLKNKAKRAFIHLCIAFSAGVIFVLGLVGIAFVFGKPN